MNRPPPWHTHPRGRAVVEGAILKAAGRFVAEDGFDPAKRPAVEAFRGRVEARRLELLARGQEHDTAAVIASLVDAKGIANACAEEHPSGRLDPDLIADRILASGETTRSRPSC